MSNSDTIIKVSLDKDMTIKKEMVEEIPSDDIKEEIVEEISPSDVEEIEEPSESSDCE